MILLESPLGLVAAALLLLLLIHFLYSHFYGPFRVLKRYGIGGPDPSPFWGNFELMKTDGLLKMYDDLYKIYGPVFGLYNGTKAEIVVADPEMLKEIMVKHFDSFVDRMDFPNIQAKATGLPKSIIFASGSNWRKARHTISPSFSSLKMKAMVPLVQKSCEALQEKLRDIAKSHKSVDICKVFGDFTMETILAAAFGCEVQVQQGEVDELVTSARAIMGFTVTSNKRIFFFEVHNIVFLLSHFPFLEIFFVWAFKHSRVIAAYKTMISITVGLINARRQAAEPAKYKDLLQLLLDANVEEKDGERKLSDLEVVSYARVFLLAGYETTANTLAYTSYLLALNPEVQEKLCAEIDEFFESHDNANSSIYEATQKLQYLDMVLQESLRMYPTAAKTSRECSKTTEIRGVTIPKGSRVHIPIHLLHHIPEYWPDPEKFDPERFTPEEKAKRPQLSHMPFGWGPRNCVGMRFALMEAKMALIYILRKFKFEQSPDTEIPLENRNGLLTMSPKNGVHLCIAEREPL